MGILTAARRAASFANALLSRNLAGFYPRLFQSNLTFVLISSMMFYLTNILPGNDYKIRSVFFTNSYEQRCPAIVQEAFQIFSFMKSCCDK